MPPRKMGMGDRDITTMYRSNIYNALRLKYFLRHVSPFVLIGLAVWCMWMAAAIWGNIALSHPIVIVTLH